MAKNIRGFKIDSDKKTITITKSLAKKASKLNSEEYDILSQLTQDYPNFKIKKSTAKKDNKYKDLSIPFMRDYITQKHADKIEAFNNQYSLYENTSKLYFEMKAWFLTACPEYEEMLDERKETQEKKEAERKEKQKEKQRAKRQAKAAAKVAKNELTNSNYSQAADADDDE